GGAVPFRPAHRAWAEMDGAADRERRGGILDASCGCAIEHDVGREIEAIKVSVFGRDRQEPLAALCLDQGGRRGNIPVVPVFGYKLEMVFVSPGLGVEDNNRAGIEISTLAWADAKSGAGLPPGTYNSPVDGSKV